MFPYLPKVKIKVAVNCKSNAYLKISNGAFGLFSVGA